MDAMLRTRTLLVTLVGLTLAATTARAGLIPNKVTVTADGSGNFAWNYNVVVTSDLYISKGDYFVIYDFNAGTAPSKVITPSGDWGVTIQNVTKIPPKYGTINPNAERFFAKRMNATTTELDSDHVAMLSHPKDVANVIMDAAAKAAK